MEAVFIFLLVLAVMTMLISLGYLLAHDKLTGDPAELEQQRQATGMTNANPASTSLKVNVVEAGGGHAERCVIVIQATDLDLGFGCGPQHADPVAPQRFRGTGMLRVGDRLMPRLRLLDAVAGVVGEGSPVGLGNAMRRPDSCSSCAGRS